MAIRTRITPGTDRELPFAGLVRDRFDAFLIAGGVLVTLAYVELVAAQGMSTKAVAVIGMVVFGGLVAGFVAVPWLMVAWVVPLFTVIPTLKIFVNPALGGLKDIVSISAVAAAAILALQRNAARSAPRLDRPTLILVGAIFLLYLVNLGGLLSGKTGHGSAWFQGLRLFNEPLCLLVAAMSLREPVRTLNAARTAFLTSAAGLALFGLVQQALGVQGLLRMGYVYGEQVRQVGSHLRSFGTLDDSFLYASYLLLAIALVLMRGRLRALDYGLLTLLFAGLFVSFVRTAAVVGLAVIGLAMFRRGRPLVALLVVLVAVAAGASTFIIASEQTSTRTVTVNPTTYLTLNGRTKLWKTRIGSAGEWPFGQGVGATGTAAERAKESLIGKRAAGTTRTTAVVDSGYLSVISDIGFVGLALFCGLLARISTLGIRAARAGNRAGWIVLAVVVVLPIDALSRESFTGYPTAYLAMLFAGLAIAASRSASAPRDARA